MKRRSIVIWGLGVMAMLVAVGEAGGAEKEFPSKPLELIVPFVAGGSSDLMCRTMVVGATSFLNHQPVMVINKAGAGTVAASKYVLDGRNDGYTLYNTSTSETVEKAIKRRF